MRRRSLFFAAAMAAAALPAFAQEISPLEPPDTSRYLRWGPLRVRPGLTIPTLGYDDNVFAISEQSTQQKIGDYFVALAPQAQGLVLFGHRAFLTFDEHLEFYVYAQQHELDYFNQFGRARVTIPFRRWGIYSDVGFDRTRDRPFEAQDVRPIRKTLPLGLGVIAKFGWRTDAELGYQKTRYTADDPNDPCLGSPNPSCFTIDRLNNRADSGLRLKARYLAFGRTRVLLDLSERSISFDDDVVAVTRDGKEHRQLVGLDFGLGGRISGTFHVGHDAFDLANPNGTGFNGLIADVALGYNLGSLGSHLTLTGARDVRYTVVDFTPLYVYTGGELGFVKYFNRFIGMEVDVGRSTLDFLGDPQGRRDDDTTGTLGVRFRISENDLGRRVEYAFRYTRTAINSTRDDLDQNRGTVGFGVTVGY